MIRNYWNKNINEWKDHTPPRGFSPYRSKFRTWQKVTIGRNDYYGKGIGSLGKFKRVAFKITPVFLFSILAAPVAVPLFLATGTYRKLGVWIREVKYSVSIKYIVNVANKSLSRSASVTEPSPLESNLNNDVMMPLLLSAKFTNSEEAKRYLQTLSCVSKALQPFVDQAALRLVNEGVITIGDLPGIDNNKEKIFAYLKVHGTKLNYLDLSSIRLTDEDITKVVSHCPKLETLLIAETSLTDMGSEEIAKLPNLKRMSVDRLTNFDKLTQLEELEIGALTSNPDTMVNLKKLSINSGYNFSLDALIHLEELNLNNPNVVPSLDKLVKLKNLKIESKFLLNLPSLDQLINLERLTLNCNAAQIPSLANLKKLQELSLVNYQLQQMPSLDHMISLIKLTLGVNCLIPYKIFDSLFELEELSVTNNAQQQQFPGLDHLENLRKLSIYCPYLHMLASLDMLVNLKELSITSQNLPNLPSLDALDLEKLYVCLPHQYLPSIFIDKQKNLKELSIIAPRLQQCPSLDALDKLEKLNLQISVQPSSFNALGKLKELTLSLVQAPSLDQLPQLEILRITGHLMNLSFDSLKNLKELIIHGSGQIPSLDPLKALEKLDLNGNFQTIPSFKNSNLKELGITDRKIKTLDINNCRALKKLDLTWCSKLKKLSFEHLINLEEIIIRECSKLREMSSLESQKKLRNLTIHGTGIKKEPKLDHLHQLENVSFF